MAVAHAAFGYVAAVVPSSTFFWGVAVLVLGSLDTVLNNNANNRAAKWAAYYVGMEVLLRMTGGNVFWEAGKYGAIILLVVGLLSERLVRPWPKKYIFFFLLLLPSLLVVNFPDLQIAREEVSFNLSGPFLLALSAIYFYNRSLSGSEVQALFRSALLPCLAMLTYLLIATPSIDEIEFGTQSNFQASGGFGPNQVSTVIGLAVFCIVIGIYFKAYLINSMVVDVLILALFVVRGLITFSRGGMIGAVIGSIILVAYSLLATKRSSMFASTLVFLMVAGGTGLVVWDYVNEQTKGRLEFRYSGKNFRTGTQKDITSGRTDIMLTELNLFYDNPLFGIGPGMGMLLVENNAGNPAHSHSEYTRLLAEHGIFGVIALLILLIAPLIRIYKLPPSFRSLPLAIFAFVLFTLVHSAMRLAIPGFFYGLVLISPSIKNNFSTSNNGATKG